MPKLRELQVAGNPLDYPGRDIVKKGSKYLIRFLQDQWQINQGKSETSQLGDEKTTVKTVNDKMHRKNRIKTKQLVMYNHFNSLRLDHNTYCRSFRLRIHQKCN